MVKPVRSNAPLALSVASVTEPGNVRLTADRMLEFDNARIGFTHAHTWAALPAARRGVINPSSAHLVYKGTHSRVEACIRALCELGVRAPVETKRFVDFPHSGLTVNKPIEWAPGVVINVKGVCWFIKEGMPIIPLLQPRKAAIKDESLAFYAALGKQAYGKGDWLRAEPEVVDLSGDEEVYANVIGYRDMGAVSEARIQQYMETYLLAKQIVDEVRSERPKPQPKSRGDDLFDLRK